MLGRKRTPISTSQRHSIYATSIAGASGTTGHGTGSRQYSMRGLRCTTGNRPLCTQADSTLKKARQRHQGKHTSRHLSFDHKSHQRLEASQGTHLIGQIRGAFRPLHGRGKAHGHRDLRRYDGTNTVSNRVLSEDLAAWSKCDAS